MKSSALALLLAFGLNGHAQKPRLLVLPVETTQGDTTLAWEVAAMVAERAHHLGRFEVFDRNTVHTVLQEQSTQLSGIADEENLVKIGRLAAGKEGLAVYVRQFSQEGVPTEEEEKRLEERGLIATVVEELTYGLSQAERYPNNIQTTLGLELRKIDVESGKTMDSWTWSGSYTGGNRAKSRRETLLLAADAVETRLRYFYLLQAKLSHVEHKLALLPLGSAVGVHKDLWFYLHTSERQRVVGEDTLRFPGEQVAVARVVSTSEHYAEIEVLRAWGAIAPDAHAMEKVSSSAGFQVFFEMGRGFPLEPTDPWMVAMQFGTVAFCSTDFGLQFGVGRATDSRHRNPVFMQMGMVLGWRPLGISTLTPRLGSALDLRIVNQSDDDDLSVSSFVFSLPLEFALEKQMSRSWNLAVAGGWRLFGTSNSWRHLGEQTEHGKRAKPTWDLDQGPKPRVDIGGAYFKAGVQWVVF